jgi:hypothetical protein
MPSPDSSAMVVGVDGSDANCRSTATRYFELMT